MLSPSEAGGDDPTSKPGDCDTTDAADLPPKDAEEAPEAASSPGEATEAAEADPPTEEDSMTGSLQGGMVSASQSAPEPVSSPVENEASAVEVEASTVPAQPMGSHDVAEAEPGALHLPEPCDITYEVTSSRLLAFVRLDEVVPCDLNQDGIVDLLALNHRLSTGYGFIGIGNGLFTEGPSLDLPFRPAAGAVAGNPCDNAILLVSSVGTIALFHPVFAQDPPSHVVSPEIDILRLGAASSDAPLAVLDRDSASDAAEVYSVTPSSLNLLGTFSVNRIPSLRDWFDAVRSWSALEISVPVLSSPDCQSIALANLNCDGIVDAVSLSRLGAVSIHLSDGLEALATQQTILQMGVRFLDLRLADFNNDGLVDIVLLDASGDVTVLLANSQS